MSHAVIFATGIAVDHLHAMQMSLTGRGPGRLDLHTYAEFTATRAAIESAARAVWIASSRNRDERILRHLQLELASVDAVNLYEVVGSGEFQHREFVDQYGPPDIVGTNHGGSDVVGCFAGTGKWQTTIFANWNGYPADDYPAESSIYTLPCN